MTTHDTTFLLLALGVLLATARELGDLAKRLGQPEVVGEIAAGILLGPTMLGVLAPGLTQSLFPAQGPGAVALHGLTTLGIILFLLVAGLEVDLPAMKRHGKTAFSTGVWGMVVPFALGLGLALAAPGVLEPESKVPPFVFALFFATALSISALPVIARILMDLNIYRTKVGVVTIGAASGNNLAGAMLFGIILGMLGGSGPSPAKVAWTVAVGIGFTTAMLTVVRGTIHRVVPWIEDHMNRSSGVLGFSISLALVGAAVSEWLGLHAVLGAFLVGVVIGDSSHFREQTRSTIVRFVSAFFAPIFFAAIGLSVDFAASFDLVPVLVVLAVATAGKVLGCSVSAWWSGATPREAGAIGFAMNARGAMEIVFGLLGYEHGVISARMFVALVVMAIVTSMMSGPAMRRLLQLDASGSNEAQAEAKLPPRPAPREDF